METYRIAAGLLCLSIVCVICATAGQNPEPILDRTKRIENPGVSILPPQGENWFLFPLSPEDNAPRGAIIRFVKSRRDDGPIVSAGVIVEDLGNQRFATPEAFLEEYKGDMRVGDMVTERQRLIEFDAGLNQSFGATCARSRQLTEVFDTPLFRTSTAMHLTHRLYCLHPHWPQYAISVSYMQLYSKNREPLRLDDEIEVFFKSVAFSASRPIGMPTR